MDRTMIWKAEEREASVQLHKKLQALAFLYPPTETLRMLLTDDMFLKPNVQGFFHVMHYLFWLLDPAEFKKRFYWPLTDKRAEASFRTATIEYLKHLKEKHQLQWKTSIKAYLVVMPGGVKFITFMLECVGFVVHELTQHRERQLATLLANETELAEVSGGNVLRMRRQNEFHKLYASEFISQMTEQINMLRERKQELLSTLQEIAQASGVSVERLTQDTFIAEFEASNRQLVCEMFSDRVSQVKSLDQPLAELRDTMQQFLQQNNAIKSDANRLQLEISKIQEAYPAEMGTAGKERTVSGDLKMNTLLAAFNCVHPSIEKALATVERLPQTNDLILAELTALQTDAQQVEKQITELQQVFKGTRRKVVELKTPVRPTAANTDGTHAIVDYALGMKYVHTPSIKLNMQDRCCNANQRLPLLEDFNHTADTTSMAINHHMLAITRSVRKVRVPFKQSLDANSTLNRSRAIDPMELLRTIHKANSVKSKSRTTALTVHNLPLLSQDWKTPQDLQNEAKIDVEPIMITPFKSAPPKTHCDGELPLKDVSVLSSSPYTPFNANERTRIAALVPTPDHSGSAAECNVSLIYALKKPDAVKKVQEAALNVQELSTSPSGRLEALVVGAAGERIIEEKPPKLQLNDITLNQSKEVLTFVDDNADTALQSVSIKEEHNENDANANNIIQPRLLFDDKYGNDDDEDLLANISDSVLKDITI